MADAVKSDTATVLEGWSPLTQCLDWNLGQLSWQSRGTQAFTTNEVPNLVNQAGMAAYRAAEVLYSACDEAQAADNLPDEICAMEMAIGLGLFSLQVLDRFKVLCTARGTDWYNRLVWYATDVTPKMLVDAKANGVFERHADRVVLGLVDALNPRWLKRIDTGETLDLDGRLFAVFHSYVLSLLPANLYCRRTLGEDKQWAVVMAQTVLRQQDALSQFTNLSIEQVKALAASSKFEDLQRLVPLYPLLDLNLTLAEVTEHDASVNAEITAVAELIEEALAEPANQRDTDADDERLTWVLHSLGADASIERTLQILHPNGLLLYRDYGPSIAERAQLSSLYQHYGSATAMGINHYALDSKWSLRNVAEGNEPVLTVPNEGAKIIIKSRFVSNAALVQTRAVFAELFDEDALATLTEAVDAAHQAAEQPEQALEAYRHALSIERDNWTLLAEAGEFALRKAENRQLAEVLTRASLQINPWYNLQAWNCLGDLYWFQGDIKGAHGCYERATQSNPEHFLGWFNLSLVARRRGQLADALELTAHAIAVHPGGAGFEQLQNAMRDCEELLRRRRELHAQWRTSRAAGTRM